MEYNMGKKIYVIDDEGKYIETQILESDKEASKAAHRSVYHIPDVKYTRVNPPKELEGYDRYFINNKWEYREVLPEPEGETDDTEETEVRDVQ